MNLGKYVACICEGASEAAVIDVLLDQNLLIFDRERMLDEQVLRCRNASTFETRYLRKGFDGSISVIRILDSRSFISICPQLDIRHQKLPWSKTQE